MTIEVTGCRILIRPFTTKEDPVFAAARKAGLAILDRTERQEQVNVEKGEVLQIGPRASAEYIEGVNVGDVVGFAKFGGKFVETSPGDWLLVINDEDIICRFKD